MSDTIIELKHIANRYGSHVVHEKLNLHVGKGEILGLIGGSGSGKSVLLRTILGLKEPNEGEVRLLGEDPYAMTEKQRRALFQKIGVVFQDGSLFSNLSVLDNVAFPLREYKDMKNAEIEKKAREAIKLVGLDKEAAEKFPSELSGGMTRRAALARALVVEPEILFLDEPTGPLDPVAADAFDELILSLKEKFDLTVLIITHDLNTLMKICTRIAMIVDKRVTEGSVKDMMDKKNPEIQAFFHGERMKALLAPRKAA